MGSSTTHANYTFYYSALCKHLIQLNGSICINYSAEGAAGLTESSRSLSHNLVEMSSLTEANQQWSQPLMHDKQFTQKQPLAILFQPCIIVSNRDLCHKQAFCIHSGLSLCLY